MSGREELIALLWDNDHMPKYDTADAILAAGYSKPRTITTAEELDALPFESVIRDAEDYVLERWGEPEDQMWATPMNAAWIRSAEVTLPATVLHEGAQP